LEGLRSQKDPEAEYRLRKRGAEERRAKFKQ